MRLLALEDCELESGHLALRTFSGTDIPRYAILSHRWTDDEVLFKDVEDGTSADRRGYLKLRGAISQARAEGFAYLWDDTCCIDKSSSAELSEAINSMWVWYREAAVCYAYLDDVLSTSEDAEFEAHFNSSAWFTRGWTLQELIAPRQVSFYNKAWTFIGTRQTLQRLVTGITGIDDEYLNHARPLSAASVAKRMSWAAHRRTTRLEDIAYCLMGLFSVNMPMLYGEGSRAFHRLQEEIIKISDDESIFAWMDPEAKADTLHGLLADSPLQFRNSGAIGPVSTARKPLQTTNLGLNIQRSSGNGFMPLLCNYRGRAGYLSIATVPVDNQVHARRRLSELPACMHVNQSGNLYFPQVVPHPDRHLPEHETVIRYLCTTSNRMQHDTTYAKTRQLSNLHPMTHEPLQIPFNGKAWEEPQAGFYVVPKFGTFPDLILQFRRPADETYVLVIVGVTNSSELRFAAGAALPAFGGRVYDYDLHRVRTFVGAEAASKIFEESAVPIGSSYDVAGLHRVVVKEASAGVVEAGRHKLGRQMRQLEIDITSLAYEPQEKGPSARLCCCVQ